MTLLDRLIWYEREQWRQWEHWTFLPRWHAEEQSKAQKDQSPKYGLEETEQRPLTFTDSIKIIVVPAGILALAALASPVSQATLAPVFGAIPSSVNHKEALAASYSLGYLLRTLARDRIVKGLGLAVLCVWISCIPCIQLYLFGFSGYFRPVGGPILLGFLSCHLIVATAVYDAIERLEALDMRRKLGSAAGSILPAMVGLTFFTFMERLFDKVLPLLQSWSETSPAWSISKPFGSFDTFAPVNLQLNMAILIFMALPPLSLSRFLQCPMMLHTLLLNPHFDSPTAFNQLKYSLSAHNWSLVDRAWTNTGYVSILESHDLRHRVMRCDHSLLGGEWLLTDDRRRKEGWKVTEPIYAVFEMLEAVRLMQVTPVVLDAEAQALVVGLGIGTAPKALIQHGINTTVVELDPMVHRFATQYFDLPRNHTVVLQDAVSWVSDAAARKTQTYDYIIHDVFTGGAEPLPLFTQQFLSNLRSLLRSDGVIAINYAGDLRLPLTSLVLNTINRVFDGQCKIFRDAPPETSQKGSDTAEQDFLNMVVFCRNSPGPVSFRRPTASDVLDSKSRQYYLLPRADFEINFPKGVADLLQSGDEGKWSSQQAESAQRHWYIMRKVLPDKVWELW